MKKGFTLVELSIVLVIIGLLIGGILIAQSMTDAAKITAQVQQISQFDAAVMDFKSKYNYLPGDAPAFGGDGDGVLAWPSYTHYPGFINTYVCEMANFWNNLFPQDYPEAQACTYDPPLTQIYTSGPHRDVPSSKMGKNGSYLIVSALGGRGLVR